MPLDAILFEIPFLLLVGLVPCLLLSICYLSTFFVPWYLIIAGLSVIYWLSVIENSPTPDEIRKRKDIFVVIIGAGYSGLCTAIQLKRKRIRFVLIEKSSNVGGTWWDNKYPGCACDIMSHFYSLSFKPNPFWSESFPSQPEILNYLQDTADYYGIREHIKFDTKVNTCKFDLKTKKWKVETSNNAVIECNFLISGIGALHVPKFPNVTGKERFEGESFHTALWKEDFDWSNKRVGVIGTGCSAVQVVPSIAPKCKELYVFQRTPSWIVSRLDFHYSTFIQKCFLYLPFIMKIHRWYIFIRQEIVFQIAFTKGSKSAKFLRDLVTRNMRRLVTDERNKEKLVPDYDIGCKRVTLSNGYLQAFNKVNVHLITNPIKEITKNGIKIHSECSSDIELDAIIYATGFDVKSSLRNVDIERPKDGAVLRDIWGDNPNAYLGMMYPEFPNFFIILGPTTGLGHNSVVWMIEQQVNYVMKAITETINEDCSTIEVTKEANDEFQLYTRKTTKRRVFSSGCVSWYQNTEGFTYILWPSSCLMYWWKTLFMNFNHFVFSK